MKNAETQTSVLMSLSAPSLHADSKLGKRSQFFPRIMGAFLHRRCFTQRRLSKFTEDESFCPQPARKMCSKFRLETLPNIAESWFL